MPPTSTRTIAIKVDVCGKEILCFDPSQRNIGVLNFRSSWPPTHDTRNGEICTWLGGDHRAVQARTYVGNGFYEGFIDLRVLTCLHQRSISQLEKLGKRERCQTFNWSVSPSATWTDLTSVHEGERLRKYLIFYWTGIGR